MINNKFLNSLIMDADGYKPSHYVQYPKGTEQVISYVEARGGETKAIQIFGAKLKAMDLEQIITKEDVYMAQRFMSKYGTPFNYDGWMYIVEELGGKLPIEIKMVDEGSVIPIKNVIATITNTDPKCYWLVNYIETMFLRIWYPITVATKSYNLKQLIIPYSLRTSENPQLDLAFKVHDFGARGTTSREQAMIGGMAHLLNFKGSDTMIGVLGMSEYYQEDVSGFSIPATEHSTITSWGREGEVEAYRNFINQYKDYPVIACVMDSYDLEKACSEMLGEELKEIIEERNGVFVARPDSGDPVEQVFNLLEIFSKKFGYTINSKGYKVLNNVRIIQGDGIDESIVKTILQRLYAKKYATDNVNFGIGGALLQRGIDRDTFKFATKCCAIKVDGEWRDVYKDPKNSFKKSKKGKLVLALHSEDKENNVRFIETTTEENLGDKENLLKTIFLNGECTMTQTLNEVKNNSLIEYVDIHGDTLMRDRKLSYSNK